MPLQAVVGPGGEISGSGIGLIVICATALGPEQPFTVAVMLYSSVIGPVVVLLTVLVKLFVGGVMEPELAALTPDGREVIKFQV